MTDNGRDDTPPLEHDEYHSSLEIDDSSGWRVFIVPGILLLFLLGAVLFIVFSEDDATPDPRLAGRLKNQATENYSSIPDAAMVPAGTAVPGTPVAAPAPATNNEGMANPVEPAANGQ